MTKEEFNKKYVGEKLVVHCDTLEKAISLLNLAHEFGHKWRHGNPYKGSTEWFDYEDKTCYYLYLGEYWDLEFYTNNDFTIVEFEEEKTMTLPEKLRLLAELAETGEEFKLHKSHNANHFFKNEELIYNLANGEEHTSEVTISELQHYEITRLPKKPQLCEKVWIIDAFIPLGYYSSLVKKESILKRLLERNEIFATEEEAQAEVERRGWKVE